MAFFKASGWNKTTGREVIWYLEAVTPDAARSYAVDAGLLAPNIEEVSAVPEDERLINVELAFSPGRGGRQPHPFDGLVWRIALGVMLGTLGAAVVLNLLSHGLHV